MKSTVEVDREALRKILQAFDSPGTLLELRADKDKPNNPIAIIIRDFNSSVAYQTITDGLFGGEL